MTSLDPSSLAYKKARRQHLKTTKNRDNDIDQDWTPFRAVEKQYKARFPPPDLSNVLDLAVSDDTRTNGPARGTVDYRATTLKDADCKRLAYIIPRIPGLVLLPSFVSPARQKQLVRWSLSDHAKYPNETNLDIHYVLPQDGLWNAYLTSRTDTTKDLFIHPRPSTSECSSPVSEPGPRKLIENTPATPSNFQSISTSPKPPPTPSPTVRPCLPSALLRKLRWANIGWYYHWGSKQYDFSKGKGDISSEVKELCKSAVGAVDWEDVFSGPTGNLEWGKEGPDWKTWNNTYEPDAGIINFYQTKDTLMAHVDRSEICATSPLVSISLGNSALFLIGGLTRDVEPVPILLRSGDIVIMSGPACRRAYHGVPRILEDTLPHHFDSDGDDMEWKPYEEYMRTTRINVNVRQVFPQGFDPFKEKRN